jgi:hypothetical protein
MLTSAHYVEEIIKHKRVTIAYMGNSIIHLVGYKFDTEFLCPFTNRKGAYIKRKDYKKYKIIDAYFLL